MTAHRSEGPWPEALVRYSHLNVSKATFMSETTAGSVEKSMLAAVM